jgi:transcriptional regulator with XRE-family HTH domain
VVSQTYAVDLGTPSRSMTAGMASPDRLRRFVSSSANAADTPSPCLTGSDYVGPAPLSNTLRRRASDSIGRMALIDDIGRQVRAARLARGLTLREAAPKCGLSYQMLGQIERGTPTTTTRLQAIAEGLGVAWAITVPDDEPAAAQPGDPLRAALLARFAAIAPYIPDEELDIFVHELALWERRYRPSQGS